MYEVTFAPSRLGPGSPRGEPATGIAGTFARWLRRIIGGTMLVAVVLVLGTAFRVWQVARIDDTAPADAIVVLGAAQYSGTPSPVFEARLEQAYKLYRRGVAPQVITVGGKQVGDKYTEAASGRNYNGQGGVVLGGARQ
jgi:vancomycin permeability regulator SanA